MAWTARRSDRARGGTSPAPPVCSARPCPDRGPRSAEAGAYRRRQEERIGGHHARVVRGRLLQVVLVLLLVVVVVQLMVVLLMVFPLFVEAPLQRVLSQSPSPSLLLLVVVLLLLGGARLGRMDRLLQVLHQATHAIQQG